METGEPDKALQPGIGSAPVCGSHPDPVARLSLFVGRRTTDDGDAA